MSAVRNLLIMAAIVGLLGLALWYVFVQPDQVAQRLREALGREATRGWVLRDPAQEGLDTFSARVVVIPADPVHEERDLAVFTGVRVRADGPFVPSVGMRPLTVSCDAGEVNLERRTGVWNFDRPVQDLAAICLAGRIAEFTCGQAVHVSVRCAPVEPRVWEFALGDAVLTIVPEGRLALTAAVTSPSGEAGWFWERGAVDVRLCAKTSEMSLAVTALNFTGMTDLAALFMGAAPGAVFTGVADLKLTGDQEAGGAAVWTAHLRATDLEMEFPGSGVGLRHLRGALWLTTDALSWRGLEGTCGGFDVTSEGTLAARPEKPSRVRLDLPAVALSSGVARLLEGSGLRSLAGRFAPDGVLSGALFLDEPLRKGGDLLRGEFAGKEIALGQEMVLNGARFLDAEIRDGVLVRARGEWQHCRVGAAALGEGSFVVRKDGAQWVVSELTCALAGGSVLGDGVVTAGDAAALTLKLAVSPTPLATLAAMWGLPFAPAGFAEGEIYVRCDPGGTVVRASAMRLAGVTFGEGFLGALGETFGVRTFDAGRLSFRIDAGGITLEPGGLVLLAPAHVLVVTGGVQKDGNVALTALGLERGALVDDVLLASDVRRWPLTEAQRGGAVCFSIRGTVAAPVLEPLEPETVLGQ